MKKLLFIITLFITTISAQVLENSVPMNLSFQGVLSSSDGTIYEDGEYELTFRIMFPSLQGVEINIWEETQSVFVANGLSSCVGVITRMRETINGIEKSAIDFMLMSTDLQKYIENYQSPSNIQNYQTFCGT